MRTSETVEGKKTLERMLGMYLGRQGGGSPNKFGNYCCRTLGFPKANCALL